MDHQTLQTLVMAHQAEVYRYVKYLGADHALAEDLVQETFLTAFQGATPPSLTDLRRRAAWLRGIARHLLLRHWEKKKRDPLSAGSHALAVGEQVWVESMQGGDDGTLYLEALRACLEQVPARSREMLDYRYRRRRSRREMAMAFAMSEDGVKSALRRIRARLAECVRARVRHEDA